MSLSRDTKNQLKQEEHQPRCLWGGPCGQGPNGGISQSLLSRYLCDKERFRLKVIEGFSTVDSFDHKIQYGQLWHVCEEALASSCPGIVWEECLKDYAIMLAKKYPSSGQVIEHWYHVCKTQFPIYVDWWARHKDVKKRQPIAEEQVFDVGYDLPSGRCVRLRGKWDSVDLVEGLIWLQENKTKGDIDQQQMAEQLSFDLQTMLYLVALSQDTGIKKIEEAKMKYGKGKSAYEKSIKSLAGIRYNVIRRPLAGGKASIKRKEPTKTNPNGESAQEFYERLGGVIREANGETQEGRDEFKLQKGEHFFFHRWNVQITPADIKRFEHTFLIPCLEELCNWYEHITTSLVNPFACPVNSKAIAYHYRFPYGVINWTLEGNRSDLDEHLLNGSEVGLTRVDHLFGELQ